MPPFNKNSFRLSDPQLQSSEVGSKKNFNSLHIPVCNLKINCLYLEYSIQKFIIFSFKNDIISIKMSVSVFVSSRGSKCLGINVLAFLKIKPAILKKNANPESTIQNSG